MVVFMDHDIFKVMLFEMTLKIQKVISEFIFRDTKMEYADNDPRKGVNEELRKSLQEHGIMRTMEILHLGRPRILEICKYVKVTDFSATTYSPFRGAICRSAMAY